MASQTQHIFCCMFQIPVFQWSEASALEEAERTGWRGASSGILKKRRKYLGSSEKNI